MSAIIMNKKKLHEENLKILYLLIFLSPFTVFNNFLYFAILNMQIFFYSQLINAVNK